MYITLFFSLFFTFTSLSSMHQTHPQDQKYFDQNEEKLFLSAQKHIVQGTQLSKSLNLIEQLCFRQQPAAPALYFLGQIAFTMHNYPAAYDLFYRAHLQGYLPAMRQIALHNLGVSLKGLEQTTANHPAYASANQAYSTLFLCDSPALHLAPETVRKITLIHMAKQIVYREPFSDEGARMIMNKLGLHRIMLKKRIKDTNDQEDQTLQILNNNFQSEEYRQTLEKVTSQQADIEDHYYLADFYLQCLMAMADTKGSLEAYSSTDKKSQQASLTHQLLNSLQQQQEFLDPNQCIGFFSYARKNNVSFDQADYPSLIAVLEKLYDAITQNTLLIKPLVPTETLAFIDHYAFIRKDPTIQKFLLLKLITKKDPDWGRIERLVQAGEYDLAKIVCQALEKDSSLSAIAPTKIKKQIIRKHNEDEKNILEFYIFSKKFLKHPDNEDIPLTEEPRSHLLTISMSPENNLITSLILLLEHKKFSDKYFNIVAELLADFNLSLFFDFHKQLERHAEKRFEFNQLFCMDLSAFITPRTEMEKEEERIELFDKLFEFLDSLGENPHIFHFLRSLFGIRGLTQKQYRLFDKIHLKVVKTQPEFDSLFAKFEIEAYLQAKLADEEQEKKAWEIVDKSLDCWPLEENEKNERLISSMVLDCKQQNVAPEKCLLLLAHYLYHNLDYQDCKKVIKRGRISFAQMLAYELSCIKKIYEARSHYHLTELYITYVGSFLKKLEKLPELFKHQELMIDPHIIIRDLKKIQGYEPPECTVKLLISFFKSSRYGAYLVEALDIIETLLSPHNTIPEYLYNARSSTITPSDTAKKQVPQFKFLMKSLYRAINTCIEDKQLHQKAFCVFKKIFKEDEHLEQKLTHNQWARTFFDQFPKINQSLNRDELFSLTRLKEIFIPEPAPSIRKTDRTTSENRDEQDRQILEAFAQHVEETIQRMQILDTFAQRFAETMDTKYLKPILESYAQLSEEDKQNRLFHYIHKSLSSVAVAIMHDELNKKTSIREAVLYIHTALWIAKSHPAMLDKDLLNFIIQITFLRAVLEKKQQNLFEFNDLWTKESDYVDKINLKLFYKKKSQITDDDVKAMIDRLLQPKRPHTFYALSLVDFALKINDNSFLRLFLSHICLLVMLSNENLNWPDDARYPYTWYVEKYDAIQASLIAAIMNTQKKDVHYYQLLAACQVICAILRTPLETEIQFTQANGKITLLTTKFKELYKMLMQQKKDVTLAQTHLDELKLFCQNIKSKANEYNQQLIQQVNDIVESLN